MTRRFLHLGRKPVEKHPIILYLQDYNEKAEILRNSMKDKGTNIYIQSDYSQETLTKRRLLWNIALDERANKLKVFLVNDKLRVGDDLYEWSESRNARMRLCSSSESTVDLSGGSSPVVKQLRLLGMNAQSIVNKAYWLELSLLNHDAHVRVTTETWLNDNVFDGETFSDSYQVFRRDHPSSGGGVAVVIKPPIFSTTLERIKDHGSLILSLDICGKK